MKTLILAAIASVGFAASSYAATQVPLRAGFDDTDFRTLCAAGGGGNQGCETAVVQIRGGDGDGGGAAESELVIQDFAPNASGDLKPVNREAIGFALADETSYRFKVEFIAAKDKIKLNFGGTKIEAIETLTGFETLFIRTNGRDEAGDVVLSDLKVNGLALDPLSGRPGYVAITDFDLSRNLLITGEATFDFFGGRRPNSSPIAEFKFTDVAFDAAPVPLPAGLPLLLAGLGALGVAKRFKKA